MSVERIHHLDWLKVLIVYGIVVFHNLVRDTSEITDGTVTGFAELAHKVER